MSVYSYNYTYCIQHLTVWILGQIRTDSHWWIQWRSRDFVLGSELKQFIMMPIWKMNELMKRRIYKQKINYFLIFILWMNHCLTGQWFIDDSFGIVNILHIFFLDSSIIIIMKLVIVYCNCWKCFRFIMIQFMHIHILNYMKLIIYWLFEHVKIIKRTF